MSDEQIGRPLSFIQGKPGMDGYLFLVALAVLPWIWVGRSLGGNALVLVPGVAVLLTFWAPNWSSAFKVRLFSLVVLVLMAVLTGFSIGVFLAPAAGFMLMGVLHAEKQRWEEPLGRSKATRAARVGTADTSSIRWELDDEGEGIVWVTYRTDQGPLERRFETFGEFEAAHPEEAELVLAQAGDDEDDSDPD